MFELHGYGSYTVQTNHLQRLSTAVLLVVGTPDYLHLDASIRNTDSGSPISKFSQSVNQTICMQLSWLAHTCQLTQSSFAKPCNTPRVSLAQENALSLTILLSIVSRTLTTENAQAPKCPTQGTIHHPPPRQAMRCASRPPAGTVHLSAYTNALVSKHSSAKQEVSYSGGT